MIEALIAIQLCTTNCQPSMEVWFLTFHHDKGSFEGGQYFEQGWCHEAGQRQYRHWKPKYKHLSWACTLERL